jgi:hypothetical protein
MFITTSSTPENGQRAYKCMLSKATFLYNAGNDQSRNDAESAARSHQGAILDNLLANYGLQRNYEFADALAAYERSLL